MNPHVVVVLAAGGSTRLGRSKQLLRRNGETLIHRAVRLAAATGPARLLVVVGGDVESVSAGLDACECELVYNDAWRDGLASSLHAAAARIVNFDGPVLVLGCDQPALELDHLSRLLEGANRSTARAAAAIHAGLPGSPAVVPGAWFADGATTGDRGFGRRLRALPEGSLFLLDAAALEADIDTADDLDLAVAGGWLDAEI